MLNYVQEWKKSSKKKEETKSKVHILYQMLSGELLAPALTCQFSTIKCLRSTQRWEFGICVVKRGTPIYLLWWVSFFFSTWYFIFKRATGIIRKQRVFSLISWNRLALYVMAYTYVVHSGVGKVHGVCYVEIGRIQEGLLPSR